MRIFLFRCYRVSNWRADAKKKIGSSNLRLEEEVVFWMLCHGIRIKNQQRKDERKAISVFLTTNETIL